MNDEIRLLWKTAKTLHNASERYETGLYLIEGQREIELARKHGVDIIQILDSSNTSKKYLERITYTGRAIAIARWKDRRLIEFTPSDNPLIVVLDCLEKPGNIGAIIRTSEAAGVSAVFLCGGTDDLTNPNTIRSSLGAIFCIPVFKVAREDAVKWLSERDIPIVTATPDAKSSYNDYTFPPGVAVVVGNEAEGVTEFWKKRADASVSIPMTGEVNSLNVSVSAAILIYKAISDRKT